MTAVRAVVERDALTGVMRIALLYPEGYVSWGPLVVKPRSEAAVVLPDGAWLALAMDDAQVIYEALADHFGSVGDEALREDYEAERNRVDLLLAFLTAADRSSGTHIALAHRVFMGGSGGS